MPLDLTGAVALVVAGAAEGYAFFKCGMFNPSLVSSQFNFSTMSMMGLFVGAMGTAMLSNVIVRKLRGAERFDNERKPSDVGYARAISGCFILGVGMAASGAGPSLFPGSLLTVKTGAYTVAGAFAGGLAWALLERFGAARVCELDEASAEATASASSVHIRCR